MHHIFTFYSLTPTYVSALDLVRAETYVGVKE
jgi:hypothetical protein